MFDKIVISISMVSIPEPAEWRYVIKSFFSEIDLFPGSGSIARFKYTPGTGHYSQVDVGCGLILPIISRIQPPLVYIVL